MKNLISCFTAVLLCQGLIAQPCMTLTMSSVQASCSTCTDATATVTATGGTVPYTYQWTVWTGSQTTQTATGLATGNYYSVTVTDSSGCYENDGIVICDTSMPSFSYVVYGQDSVVFTNTSSAGNGWYSISFGDGNSFPGTPFSYWTSDSISHVYDTPGTYNVCLYDTQMNCTQSFFCDSIVIGCNMTGTITGNPISCYGAADGNITVAIMGGTGPFTYLWNNGAIGSSISNLVAGTYEVTVTDSSGCTLTLSYTITEPAALALSMSSVQASCSTCTDGTATVTATGGTVPYTYSWYTTPIQTSSTATGLKNGYGYWVMVTDVNGCSQSDYIFVCDTASIPSFTYVVYGQDSVVFTNTSAGNGNYGLIFGDGGGSLSNWAPGTNHTYTYSGPGTYNVCIIDTLSCSMSFCDSVVISVTSILTEYSKSNILVYPNPTTGILTIEGLEGLVEIYDLYGKLVKSTKGNTLDISQLANGIYFLQATDEQGEVYSYKIIKE